MRDTEEHWLDLDQTAPLPMLQGERRQMESRFHGLARKLRTLRRLVWATFALAIVALVRSC